MEIKSQGRRLYSNAQISDERLIPRTGEPETTMKKKLKSDSPLRAATGSPSSAPRTEKFRKSQLRKFAGVRATDALEKCRELERDADHWRNEHDRILREFQHRLTVLATSAIEATHYPENEIAQTRAQKESK